MKTNTLSFSACFLMQRRVHALLTAAALCCSVRAQETQPQTPVPAKGIDERLQKIEKEMQELVKTVAEVRDRTAPSTQASTPADSAASTDPISRIREEGLQRSQVMETLSYLTEVIGPRLTGSPNLKRANEWTRDKLASWGLTNAHLEAWGHFGRGWSLKRFSAQLVEPYTIPLIGFPKAWSPGLVQPIEANVVYLDASTEADLEKYKGQLKDAVVLTAPVREVRARFEPLAARQAETNLLRLANASRGTPGRGGAPAGRGRGGRGLAARGAATTTNAAPAEASSGRRGGRGGPGGRANLSGRILTLLLEEQAALAVSPSSQGDGGTLFVAGVSLPGTGGRGGGGGTNAPRYYSTNAPATPPQLTLAIEDYNRLVRMIQRGEKLKMAVEMAVQFHDDDWMAYNIFAEIPGGDLKDEVVMLGGHIDSWHSGTGATDNGAGVAAALEAVRIIAALDLKPRRTIRVGLWSGEEQGLLGSRAYVSQHFGYYTNTTDIVAASSENASDSDRAANSSASASARSRRTFVRHEDYEKFSAYFNLDNGTGKIRGVYMQGNEAVRPIFRQWLEPFVDHGAATLTLSNTGGTDHQSFDAIGLPGFQFIQDAIEYSTRTHHSNADVLDRIQADDLKQAATIMAAFAYNAAMIEEKLPRKPVE